MLLSSGCNLVTYPLYALNAGRTRKVSAEYKGLSGKKVCVWVWADESLLFNYPSIRLDIASHARYFIMQSIKDIRFVKPSTVANYQRSQYGAETMPIVSVGKHFGADVVLFIQVMDFRTRPPTSPSLFQGFLNAHCSLYDCTGNLPIQSEKRKLWSGIIQIVYPERRLMDISQTNDLAMRSTLLKLFGDKLAKKFYDHQVLISEGDE